MHKRLASEMACFAICQRGWTTALINQWATILLYADKGDMSFGEKKSSQYCKLCIKCTSLKAESLFNIKLTYKPTLKMT